jgi:hypothetical protein
VQGRRYIRVRSTDTLVINGLALDVSILEDMLQPNTRVLWAFVHDETTVRPVPYSEDRCIWLTDEDLVRNEKIEG